MPQLAPEPFDPLKIVVLISGGGTTLQNLLQKIREETLPAQILKVISSNPQAGGLRIAEAAGIPTAVVERKTCTSTAQFSKEIFDHCRAVGPHLIVMGGFLKLVEIPKDFENRVMNIHPALIPSFCGQGLFGQHVHEAVLNYGARISGCTVHFVDQQYDHGPIILQTPVPVREGDTPETLAQRVFAAECQAYPEALRLFAQRRLKVVDRKVVILPDPSDSQISM